jgi:hypothetical protein
MCRVEPPQDPPKADLCLFGRAVRACFQGFFDPHVQLPIGVKTGPHLTFRHAAAFPQPAA